MTPLPPSLETKPSVSAGRVAGREILWFRWTGKVLSKAASLVWGGRSHPSLPETFFSLGLWTTLSLLQIFFNLSTFSSEMKANET